VLPLRRHLPVALLELADGLHVRVLLELAAYPGGPLPPGGCTYSGERDGGNGYAHPVVLSIVYALAEAAKLRCAGRLWVG
jgi:hypothetical protein